MAGDVRSKFSTREIDDQTPVKVVSSDDNGAVVEIVEGPMKGRPALSPNRTWTEPGRDRLRIFGKTPWLQHVTSR
jgi:hypothetical protein